MCMWKMCMYARVYSVSVSVCVSASVCSLFAIVFVCLVYALYELYELYTSKREITNDLGSPWRYEYRVSDQFVCLSPEPRER